MSESLEVIVDGEMKAAFFQLFAMAKMPPPSGEVKGQDLLLAIRQIKSRLDEGGKRAAGTVPGFGVPVKGGAAQPTEDGPFGGMASEVSGLVGTLARSPISSQNILIVGELGIITYQLKLALRRYGANVTIVKGMNEAIMEYQKTEYSGVLIDILMPTEREGLLVLMEIKRIEREKRIYTDVVVLTTHVKEKGSNLREICRQKGAALYLEKSEGWHQKVLNFFGSQGVSQA